MIDDLNQDLKYAVRQLVRRPGFAAVLVLTLALGIGANSAIFSVVKGVLLQSLPYEEPAQLVRILHRAPDEGLVVTEGAFSPQDFQDLKRESTVYDRLAGYLFIPGNTTMNLVGGREPEQVATALVSADFFRTLGVSALLGRALVPAENVPGADRVVVLSHGFWRSRFGADPGIVGQTVSLDGEPFAVVGVMPPSFDFPSREAEIWAPISLIDDDDIPHRRGLRWMSLIARLEPGTTLETATAGTNALLRRLEDMYPATNEGWGSARVITLHEALVGEVRPALLVLLGAVALVLLIACVNLANLLLAQGTARGREIAIRAAVGARRSRVIRQLLTETMALAVVGGVLGLILAFWGVDALLALSAGTVPRPEAIRLDGWVVGFTLLLSVLTGLVFGLVPALKAARVDFGDALNHGRGSAEGGRRAGTRRALVAGEIALAVVLLAGAGLMVRSFWSLSRVDSGFRAENVLVLGLQIPSSMFVEDFDSAAARVTAYRRELFERIENLPGVEAVGGSPTIPLHGGGEPFPYSIPGRTDTSTITPQSGTYIVTPSYFRALGIPFVNGGTFRETADSDGSLEVIINRAMAQQYWPGEDPVGGVVRLGDNDLRIAGVVENVRSDGIAETPAPALYVPYSVFIRSTLNVFVRTASDPLRVAGAVREAIWEINPDQPIANVTTMRQVVSETVAQPRFVTLLLGLFGGFALLLAAIGVYGVLSHSVSQRTHDIGIRMALGARAGDVLRMILGETLALVGTGLALGLLGAFALTRLLSSLLYDVSTTDPATFAGVVLVLAGTALLAAYIPAHRATRVDLTVALRAE